MIAGVGLCLSNIGEIKEALTLGTTALQGFQPVSIGLTWKSATEVNLIVTVTAVYERDVQGRWLVHIAEEPRCHTWARSYASARREIIDAAELWLDELGVESLDNLDIRDEVRIAGAAQARELARAREELTRRLATVRSTVDEAACGLVAEGVSVRDVADLLGISPGRVSQVIRHFPSHAQRFRMGSAVGVTVWADAPSLRHERRAAASVWPVVGPELRWPDGSRMMWVGMSHRYLIRGLHATHTAGDRVDFGGDPPDQLRRGDLQCVGQCHDLGRVTSRCPC